MTEKWNWKKLEEMKGLARAIENGFAGDDVTSKTLAKLVLDVCENCNFIDCDGEKCWEGIGR